MTEPDPLRRTMLAGVIPASFALCAGRDAQAAQGAASETWLKLICDLNGRTVWSITEGMVWGFKPQADDLTTEDFARRLYGYRSLAARKARRRPDGAVEVRTKAWSFYLDRDSREPVLELLNPYTGKMVSCPPLSGPASTAVYGASVSAPDHTLRRIGDTAWIEVDRISRFKPADTTWYKLEADMTTYACRAQDLERRGATHIPSTWSHNLVAEWQTWMKMHGEPGHILFNGGGTALGGPKDIPAGLKASVDTLFPGTLAQVLAWG